VAAFTHAFARKYNVEVGCVEVREPHEGEENYEETADRFPDYIFPPEETADA
jgi:hypothetical protein